MLRKIICIVLLLLLLLMLWITLTVPVIAATGPAILSIALAVLLWIIWSKRNRTTT